MAATLWGDRNGTEATGFLFHAEDGFASPPHIHNVSYRGVVIRGVIHNDHPDAAERWMPQGSYWTQPRGATHITAARGDDVLAYIEIDEGPYLVRPVDEAFDSGETAVNVPASEISWDAPEGRARSAPLWGDPSTDSPSGALLGMPAGSRTTLRDRGRPSRAVVIQGRVRHGAGGANEGTSLPPGSYVASSGTGSVELACEGADECILYVRGEGPR